MIRSLRLLRPLPGLLSLAVVAFSVRQAEAMDLAQTFNPISHVARIFNSDLVKIEGQVKWLENRVSTLAPFHEQELKTGIGCRAGRLNTGDPDPTVVLDLGTERLLETLFLIPAQRESANDPGLFPRKFTIELSNRADFGQRMVLFTSGASRFPVTDGRPVRFMAHGFSARYIRLTVHEGHHRGDGDIFSLSEFVAISEGEPVSFGAKVTGEGILTVPGIWGPEFLTDARTPLGIWQSGEWAGKNHGDSVLVTPDGEKVSWTVSLEQAAPLDRIVLFPFLASQLVDSAILPDAITFEVGQPNSTPMVVNWTNPLPGSIQTTPLMIPLHGASGSRVTVTATSPWQMGALKIQAFSEMEVWSAGRNLIEGKSVIRTHAGQETPVTTLTDKFASERQVIPVAAWFNQLHERSRLESQLASLRPLHYEMATESELNATWGSAIMLGLTFLIPVFIVERRRLINRHQLENLRKRIASDLHDDIGSNLGSISLIARTARKDLVRLHGPEEVAEDLGEVESIARESSLAMRDIVWLLERRADSIGDLVQRMRDTANRLLRDVEYSLECESCKTATKLSLDAKRHLFLFYKETIHNIFKHSKATRVSLRLWDQDDKLVMEVCDNGVGFDTGSTTRANPVQKLDERARVLGGQLDILSIPSKGTSIRLTVKRSHLIAHPSIP